jgi:hypothetical protein
MVRHRLVRARARAKDKVKVKAVAIAAVVAAVVEEALKAANHETPTVLVTHR